MITKITTPSAANAYRQFPQAGSGIQTDPFDWYTKATVIATVSTVTVAEAGNYDSIEKYYNAKLTASQLYTFSISGVDDMSTTATIYYEGTQVAQSVFDYMEWTWGLSYTPDTTGTYLIKVATFSYGGAGTLSVTPVPSEITPWIEKASLVYASTGFDADKNNNLPRRYSSASLAGLIGYPPNVVFALIASKGLEDKSATPVALTADGTLKISNGAFDFTSGDWRILAASTEKLNFGAGNWTVEVIASGAQKVTSYPNLLGSSNGWAGGFGFVYKHDAYSNTVGMSWETVGDPSITGSSSLTDGTVYKMRFVRAGNTLYYYQDDILNNTAAIPSGHENDVVNFNNNSGSLHIGRNNWDGSAGQFYGKIYSIIISNIAIL